MGSPPRRLCNEEDEDAYADEQAQQVADVLKRAAEVAVPQSPRREATGLAQEDAEGGNAGSTAKPSGAANAVRRGGEAGRQGLSDHGEAAAERGGASSEDIVTVAHEHTEQQTEQQTQQQTLQTEQHAQVQTEQQHTQRTRGIHSSVHRAVVPPAVYGDRFYLPAIDIF